MNVKKALTQQHATLMARARWCIQRDTKECTDPARPAGWLGIAPSYLCVSLNIGVDKANAVLLALEAEGFIYDNGNGGPLQRADGRVGTNRFYMREKE
jgi:hypothetical protein